MSNKTKVPVTAAARLKNDYLRLKKEPIPLVYAEVRTYMVFVLDFYLSFSPIRQIFSVGIIAFVDRKIRHTKGVTIMVN